MAKPREIVGAPLNWFDLRRTLGLLMITAAGLIIFWNMREVTEMLKEFVEGMIGNGPASTFVLFALAITISTIGFLLVFRRRK